MRNDKKIFYWLFAPVIAFVFLIARVYPVLPAVMQDEYIYSSESRHVAFADQAYPNYLFSFVYKSTSACGEGYYSCAKNLNIIFFLALLVFVYLIASRLLGRGYAIAAVTLTILSPLGESISFFMPETMYFTFMLATIWLALKAASHHKWQLWLITGAMLGLTTLVKPHGLFALPVFIVFALLMSVRVEGGTWVKALTNGASILVASLALKFGLGFAFAGTAGLTLFGSGYSGTVGSFVGSSSGGKATVPASEPLGLFLSTSASQLIMHGALLILVWGIPIFLAMSVLWKVLAKREVVTELGAFVSLVAALAVVYAVVVAFFEGMVTALGDDHSQRVITRYYDFLIPLLVTLAFTVQKYVEPKRWVRITQSSVLLLAVIWVLIYFPSGVSPKIADSVPLMGLLYQPWVVYLVGAIVIGLQIAWLINPEKGGKALSIVVAPLLIVIIGLSAQASLIQKIGTQKAYFDVAGQTVKPYLSAVDGKEIIVIGGVRPEVVTAKFWIDKPYINELLVGQDGTVNLDEIKDKEYALFLGTSDVEGVGAKVVNGDKFVLIKVQH